MLTVHHLKNSRSQRVLWLLEELGLTYEVVPYVRDPRTMLAPESLRAVHPLGRSPVLVDEGQALAESGAILEYLLERYGAGRFDPAIGSPERLRYRYWMHYAEGSLMPLLLLRLIATRIPKGRMPFFAKPIAKKVAAGIDTAFVAPNLARHLAFVEAELERSPWLAGNDFTVADIQMSFPLEAAMARAGVTATSHPRIAAFVDRIHARPAYQRAEARGGPVNPAR